MNKSFIFFLIASIILLLSISALNIAPVINKKVGGDWHLLNCLKESDQYNQKEEDYKGEIDDKIKEENDLDLKRRKNAIKSCNRKRPMYGLEYSAFIIDIIVGFICSLLGFLHYLEEEKAKSFLSKTGLIGLFSGVIAFAITLVYLIYTILVYSKDTGEVIKADENLVFAKWDNNKKEYHCLNYEDDNENSIFAKYSEYGKKQYNYNKDKYMSFITTGTTGSEFQNCARNNYDYANCIPSKVSNPIGSPHVYVNDPTKECTQLYIMPTTQISNLDLYNRWLTTIILSAIIVICNICLAIIGFTLFKNKEESG